jgi:hypothetical protein
MLSALLACSMNAPDGMGADRYHERRNMKPRDDPPLTHDVIAVDIIGAELFVCDSAFSEEGARATAEDLNNPRPQNADTIPAKVDHYEVRERE